MSQQLIAEHRRSAFESMVVPWRPPSVRVAPVVKPEPVAPERTQERTQERAAVDKAVAHVRLFLPDATEGAAMKIICEAYLEEFGSERP